ncbi:MAG TPA: cell division FtsA domain-containing protein [Candidatus Saccharimonas sp.]|nr:cell division FtsA domain-containing protein [Candidatus Saccharimonas sp.]
MILDKLKQALPTTGKGPQHILALDIGTEFIKALIAEIDGDKLKIIGVGREHQGLSDMHSGAIADIGAVVRNCEAALSDAEQQAGVQAKKVVIGIAGELVKGVTNTIRYKRPQPDVALDMREMEFIIEKVQERAHAKAQKQIAWETGNEDVEIKLVNSAIVSIHIDGYKVSNPIGFQGKDVAIQIYTAFAPMVHIGALERTAQELDLDLIAVAAEPFAVSRSVLGTDASSTFTAILVDVGGGTTDIGVVNDGGVEGTKMFGIGGRSFTKTIATDMDLSFDDAEKLKLNVEHDNLKSEARKKINAALDKTLNVWINGVELALGEFDAIDHLPSRMLLCGGGASLAKLVETLETTDWYKALPFTRKPTVQRIQPAEVQGITDATGNVTDHTFITAMGLLRVGYDTIVGSADTSNSLKDTFNRILSS